MEIGYVNEFARATLSYSSRRGQDTSWMQARTDSQQDRLDSLGDLLDLMALENPTFQRVLEARRAALKMQQRNPESTDRESQEPSATANYV